MKKGVPRPLELAHREIKRRTRAVVVKVEEEPQPANKEEPEQVEQAVGTITISSCTHCHTTHTPMWRRNSTTRAQECNACNVYYRKHGVLRPLELANRRRGGGGRTRAGVAVVKKKEEPTHYTPVTSIKKEEGVKGKAFDFEEFMAL